MWTYWMKEAQPYADEVCKSRVWFGTDEIMDL